MDTWFGLDLNDTSLAIDDITTLPEGADYRHEILMVREGRGGVKEAAMYVRWWPQSIADPPCKVAPVMMSMHDARIPRPDRCGEIDAWSRADLCAAIRTLNAAQ